MLRLRKSDRTDGQNFEPLQVVTTPWTVKPKFLTKRFDGTSADTRNNFRLPSIRPRSGIKWTKVGQHAWHAVSFEKCERHFTRPHAETGPVSWPCDDYRPTGRQRWQEVQECQFDIRSITGAAATREPLDPTKVRRALPPASLEGSVLNLDGTRDPFDYATA